MQLLRYFSKMIVTSLNHPVKSATYRNFLYHQYLLLNYLATYCRRRSLFSFLILFFIFISPTAFSQENEKSNDNVPQIFHIYPPAASPGVYVNIRGTHLLADDDSDATIFFVKNGIEYPAERFGSGATDNDAEGFQTEFLSTFIPEDLQSGIYQIVVELKGKRSQPHPFEITTKVSPPVLKILYAETVNPGTGITIEGTGFSASDTLELTDSSGQVQQVNMSPHADSAYFNMPATIPDGSVLIQVVEHRSGQFQASNRLQLQVLRGPVPLYLMLDWLLPAAPGQTLLLNSNNIKPIENATKLEIRLRQGTSIYETFMKPAKDPRLKIPETFSPGVMTIENRVWQGTSVSPWSNPLAYEIQKTPTPPFIHNIQIWAPDTKAVFLVKDQIIAKMLINLEGFPKVEIPSKLKPGTYFIEKHYMRSGNLIKEPYQNFDCCPVGNKTENKYISLRTMAKWNFPVTLHPTQVEIYAGDIVVIDGDFLMSELKELKVFLLCGNRQTELKARSRGNLGGVSVNIPRTIVHEKDPCRLKVLNILSRTERTIAIDLNIKVSLN